MINNVTSFLLFAVLLCSSCSLVSSEVQCIGANKKPVDWFVVYKLPGLKSSDFAKDGTGMAYMDSRLSRWIFLNETIDQTHQPVADTLNQIYSRVKDNKMDPLLYLLYNDDTPVDRKQSASRAHAKGGLAFDRKTGFWLVHTIPRYPPPASEGYAYPESATIYGQVMLCLSLNSDQLEKIGLQMDYMRPQVYDSYSSDDFAVEHKSMWTFIKEAKLNKVVDEDFSNMETLTTMAGTKIVSFSKSRKFGKDLYEDLISPSLHNNLLVQSWMNGQNNLNSVCKVKYTVKNIKTLDFGGLAFKSSKDHSKWAVTDPASKSGEVKKVNGGKKISGGGGRGRRKMKSIKADSNGDDVTNVPGYAEQLASLINIGSPSKYRKETSNKSLKRTKRWPSTKGKAKENKNKNGKDGKGEGREDAGDDKKMNFNPEDRWFCIGDINRQASQATRGGGALCIRDGEVWKGFHDNIRTVEGCDGKEMPAD